MTFSAGWSFYFPEGKETHMPASISQHHMRALKSQIMKESTICDYTREVNIPYICGFKLFYLHKEGNERMKIRDRFIAKAKFNVRH